MMLSVRLADFVLMVQWNLGFVQPPQGTCSLLRHQFRSKVGGRPVSTSFMFCNLMSFPGLQWHGFASAGVARSGAFAFSRAADLQQESKASELSIAGAPLSLVLIQAVYWPHFACVLIVNKAHDMCCRSMLLHQTTTQMPSTESSSCLCRSR